MRGEHSLVYTGYRRVAAASKSCADDSVYGIYVVNVVLIFFFFQAEDGIRDYKVTGVQTCALPISAQFREVGAALFEEGANAFARFLALLRAHHVLRLQLQLLFQRVARRLAAQVDRKSVV